MDDESMPSNFGLKYVFWMVCRWIFKNPLTILNTAQLVLVQLVSEYPTLRWLATAAAVVGIIIGQARNKGIDYTVPLSQSNRTQAKAVLAANPPNPQVPK